MNRCGTSDVEKGPASIKVLGYEHTWRVPGTIRRRPRCWHEENKVDFGYKKDMRAEW